MTSEWIPFDPIHDATPREMWDFSNGIPQFEFLAGADAPSGIFKKGDIVKTHPLLMSALYFTHYRRAE